MTGAVVDTNVIVSGLLGSPTARKIYILFKNRQFNLFISHLMFDELINVLNRPKFGFLISKEEIKEVVYFVQSLAIFVSPQEKIFECRDPKDNFILEAALSAKPDCLVSGDKDLLSIKTFHKIPIITPTKFLKMLSGS